MIGIPGLEQAKHPRSGQWLPVVHFLAFLFGFAGPSWIYTSSLRTHCGGSLTACKSNLKNMATALELYASDFGGRYPPRLEQLSKGSYLKQIPTCPAAGEMTYTNYHASQNPDDYHLACSGDNHAKAYTGYSAPSYGYPRYSADTGLLDHP